MPYLELTISTHASVIKQKTKLKQCNIASIECCCKRICIPGFSVSFGSPGPGPWVHCFNLSIWNLLCNVNEMSVRPSRLVLAYSWCFWTHSCLNSAYTCFAPPSLPTHLTHPISLLIHLPSHLALTMLAWN